MVKCSVATSLTNGQQVVWPMSLKTAKPFQRRIRKNILRLVGAKNITLERLALEADLTSSFVSQVLAGRSSISLASLERLAHALDVDVVELFKA